MVFIKVKADKEELLNVKITIEVDGAISVKNFSYEKVDVTPQTIAEKIADHAYGMAETILEPSF